MFGRDLNPASFPSQGAWVICSYSNMYTDKPHLDYIHSVSSKICVVSSEPTVHPSIQAHWPDTLTFSGVSFDKPFHSVLLDGKVLWTNTLRDNIKDFAESPSKQEFQRRWGIQGMKWLRKQTTQTIWNRISISNIAPDRELHDWFYWWSLVPDYKLENFCEKYTLC